MYVIYTKRLKRIIMRFIFTKFKKKYICINDKISVFSNTFEMHIAKFILYHPSELAQLQMNVKLDLHLRIP